MAPRLCQVDLVVLASVPALVYVAVTALVCLDAIVPAVPSEVAVVTAGAVAAAGELNLAVLIVAAAAGAAAGDFTVYAIGRHTLPGSLQRFRLGRRAQRGVERAYARMGPASGAAIIVGRFVPLGRTASAAAAGLGGVGRQRFLAFSLVGSIGWSASLAGIGFTTGSLTDAPVWQQAAFGVGIALVAGVWVAAIHAVIRTRRRMSARAEADTELHRRVSQLAA